MRTAAQQIEGGFSRKSDCCPNCAEQHDLNSKHPKSAARGRSVRFFFFLFNLHSDGRNKQLKQADEGIYMTEMFQGILISKLFHKL